MTDSLQSLVLPPLIYLLETRRPLSRQRPWPFFAQHGGAASAAPVTYGAVGSGDAAAPGPTLACSGGGAGANLRAAGLALLAAFGVCFIGFATHANLDAIGAFLRTQAVARAQNQLRR
jgi:hypothetical protein